jgi:hypothetical protein
MDPNETLRRIRANVDQMRRIMASGEEPAEAGEYYRIASELAEDFDNLDCWIVRGGFLPAFWAPGSPS